MCTVWHWLQTKGREEQSSDGWREIKEDGKLTGQNTAKIWSIWKHIESNFLDSERTFTGKKELRFTFEILLSKQTSISAFYFNLVLFKAEIPSEQSHDWELKGQSTMENGSKCHAFWFISEFLGRFPVALVTGITVFLVFEANLNIKVPHSTVPSSPS